MPPTRTRFKVLGLAVMLAGITYLDRVCIGVAAPAIRQELGLSIGQMSWVFAAFQFAYGVFEIPTGHWGDQIGTRKVLTRIVLWWSTFTMVTAAAFNYASLIAIRFLFGIGEAGAWPNVARTFSRWFPVSERSTVQGIFFMGAHLAGAVTPLLVTYLLGFFSWRTVFLLFGSVGFLWALVWWTWFRDEPSQHAAVSAAERALIEEGRVPQAKHELTWARFRELLSHPSILGLCGMYFTQSWGFNFYITWLPTYLKDVRGFTDKATFSLLAGLPLGFSVAADLFGGITADRLARKHGLRKGRLMVGFGSLMSAGLLLIAGVWMPNAYVSAVLIGLSGGMIAFLLGGAWATVLDIGGNHAGLVGAAMNTSGQVGAFLCPLMIGYMVQWFGNWTAPLYFTGLLYCLGALCWFKVDPAKPVWAH